MKTKKLQILILAFTGLFTIHTQAQKAHENGFLENYGVAAKIGLYGPGIDFHTSLLPNLKARVGFNYLAYNYTDEIYFDADNVIYDQNKPQNGPETLEGNITDAKLKFPNVNLLVDYYPSRSGIFCLTGGFYIGNNKVDALGSMTNYTAGEFEFDDVIIKPNSDGSFGAKLRMGNVVKPYIGIGLGRTISQSRVGCRFDLGVIYQGKYTIESDNMDTNSVVKANDMAADFDLPFSKSLLDWWPMLSFSLSYRIK